MRASPRSAVLAVVVLVAACGGSAAPSSVATPAASATETAGPSPSLALSSPATSASPVPASPGPKPTPTPVAVVSPSPARTTAPTPAPTPTPSPRATPKPTQKPTAPPAVVTLALAAQDLAFTPTSLSVRAGARFRIAFTNRDATVDHSVGIRNAGGEGVFNPGTPVTGIASITYAIPALPAGAYTFYCTVHSFMTGTLTVH